MLITSAWADSDRPTPHNVTQSNDMNNQTAGDMLLGGDSSKALGLGFSYALGDVDLNEGRNCFVSTAKGNILFGRQKVELNPWCASLFYDANRKHEFAARLRCIIDDIIKQYDTKDECVIDQTLSTIGLTNAAVIEGIVAKFQEFEDEREILVSEIQQQLEEQEQQYEELAARRIRPTQVIQQAAPEPFISQALAKELKYDRSKK